MDFDQLGSGPRREEDLQGWLAFQKKKWKLQRQLRKHRQQSGVSGDTVRARGGSMNAYFARQQASFAQKYWQIIQVQELEAHFRISYPVIRFPPLARPA